MISRRLLFLILFIIAIFAIGIGVQFLPGLDWIVDHEQSLRRAVASAPISSWFLALLLYFGLSLLPGTAGKSIVCGWLFGFLAALVMVEVGLTGAAVVSFLLGRFVVRNLVQRRWQARLRVISRRFDREGAFYLLLLRFAHAPFTLVNYGAGATKLPLSTFWWTTHLGILPGTLVFTFVGSRIPNLSMVAERGVWALVDFPLLAALLATALFPIVMRPLLRSLAKRAHRPQSHLSRMSHIHPPSN